MTDNPYVGPRSIKDGEAFFGRDREIRSLSALLLAERIVLLHSPSGAGKSSLIEAGLRPRMAERFRVSPLVRVNLEIPDELHGVSGLNRYLISTLLSLEEGWPLEQRLPLTELATLSLDAYLEKRALPDDSFENSLLLFDQFEEVLTVSPTDAPAKQQFFEQLGDALQNRRRWALFAIREDYMGGLAPYVRVVPNRLSVTFRLELLGTQAARLAIQQPAKDKGVDFTDDAAQKLVDDLSRVHIQQSDGSFISQPGPDVEPVQLQVVCFDLWQHLPNGTSQITAADLSSVGSVDESLAQYYAASVADVAAKTSTSERDLRTWFDKQLLTGSPDQPVRGQVRKGQDGTEGLVNVAVDGLIDAHIIRAEPRAGAMWYELAHDRLVGPVRSNNQGWFERNLRLFQRQAELWNKQGHSEGLLLRGKELANAEKDIASLDLTANEVAFLEACHRLQKQEQRERRQVRLIFTGFIISMIFLGIAVYFAVSSNIATQNAERNGKLASTAQSNAERQKATAQTAGESAVQAQATTKSTLKQTEIELRKTRNQQLSAQAELLQNEKPSLSILLALEAININKNADEKVSDVAYQALRDSLSNTKGIPLAGNTDSITVMKFSPDGRWLATGCKDKIVRVWAMQEANFTNQVKFSLSGHSSEIRFLFFSADGTRLVSVGTQVLIWDLTTDDPMKNVIKLSPNYLSSIEDFALSPDGRWAAAGNAQDGKILIWDLKTNQTGNTPFELALVCEMCQPGMRGSPGANATYKRWRQSQSQILHLLFTPDSARLLASNVSSMKFWVLTSGEPTEQGAGVLRYDVRSLNNFNINDKTIYDLLVKQMTFTPDGTQVIINGENLYGYSEGNIYKSSPWTLFSQSLFSITKGSILLAISPDGSQLATSFNNTIKIVNLHNPERTPIELPGHQGVITAMAFSPDAHWLASASGYSGSGMGGQGDGTVRIWDLNAKDPPSNPVVIAANSDEISLAFDPLGKWLAISSENRLIRLLNLKTQNFTADPTRMESTNFDILVHPEMPWMLNERSENLDFIKTFSDKVYESLINAPTGITSTLVYFESALSPNGRWITYNATNHNGDNNHLASQSFAMDLSLGKTAQPQTLSIQALKTGIFSLDSRWLFASPFPWGSSEGYLADFGSGNTPKLALQLDSKYTFGISRDSRWLTAIGNGDGYLYDLHQLDPFAKPILFPAEAVAFSSDNRWLAVGDRSTLGFRVRDISTSPAASEIPLLSPLVKPEDSQTRVLAVGFSPNNQWTYAATCTYQSPSSLYSPEYCQNFTVHLANFIQPNPSSTIFTLSLPGGGSYYWNERVEKFNIQFSGDNRWLFFWDDLGNSILVDFSKNSPKIFNYPANNNSSKAMQAEFSADSRWLSLRDYLGNLKLFDLSQTDPAPATFLAAGDSINISQVFFSFDSRWFATLSGYGQVVLYDLSAQDGAARRLNQHNLLVTSFAFSPDNAMMAAGTPNGRTLLWNITDLIADSASQPILLQGGTKAYNQITFTPDNLWLMARGKEEPVVAWRLDFEKVLAFACTSAGRNLTHAEWTQYGFTEPYRATCLQFGLEAESTAVSTP